MRAGEKSAAGRSDMLNIVPPGLESVWLGLTTVGVGVFLTTLLG